MGQEWVVGGPLRRGKELQGGAGEGLWEVSGGCMGPAAGENKKRTAFIFSISTYTLPSLA